MTDALTYLTILALFGLIIWSGVVGYMLLIGLAALPIIVLIGWLRRE